MNPRAGITDLPLFESGPFNHLGTSPEGSAEVKTANYDIIEQNFCFG